MEIKDLLERLKNDKKFKDWKKKNEKSFLAHVFKCLDDSNIDEWQIGFYNKDDTITTFTLTPSEITSGSSDEVFKRPDARILELDEGKIKIDITNALETAEKIQNTEYKQEIPFKIIAILQRLDIGQIYNITYVTQSFNILNFKIDSCTGKLLKKTLTPLMEFRKKEKG